MSIIPNSWIELLFWEIKALEYRKLGPRPQAACCPVQNKYSPTEVQGWSDHGVTWLLKHCSVIWAAEDSFRSLWLLVPIITTKILLGFSSQQIESVTLSQMCLLSHALAFALLRMHSSAYSSSFKSHHKWNLLGEALPSIPTHIGCFILCAVGT